MTQGSTPFGTSSHSRAVLLFENLRGGLPVESWNPSGGQHPVWYSWHSGWPSYLRTKMLGKGDESSYEALVDPAGASRCRDPVANDLRSSGSPKGSRVGLLQDSLQSSLLPSQLSIGPIL
jgi:hypothetical protein